MRSCLVLILFIFLYKVDVRAQSDLNTLVKNELSDQISREMAWALDQKPQTVTAFVCDRSAGTIHDFYSEGDYWWPDPDHPDGPYIQRDGMTNPDNFTAHRLAMIRFSRILGALASAYKLRHDDRYVKQAMEHLKAWFINPDTRMNPSLLYAQAIKGKVTGRGIGIIDTIHLMEVAQAVRVLEKSPAFEKAVATQTKDWFGKYLHWLTTHPYSADEMNAKNNHATCWVMQVASFAKLTGNDSLLTFCIDRYKTVLLPDQMSGDGSFPLELKRTKPYGYSIFNLDAMVMICQILSDSHNNLWTFETKEGKGIRKGVEFLYPYLNDKSKWPYPHDVLYWNDWPVAQPALLFGGAAFNKKEWIELWKKLDHQPEVPEVIRNLPIRHPLIWME